MSNETMGPGQRTPRRGGITADRRARVVDPRNVWMGVAAALVGVVVAGVAITTMTWWLVAPAALVITLGAVVAFRGGVMQDTRGADPRSEISQVRHHDMHWGVAPGQMIEDPMAKKTSREVEAERRRILAARSRTPSPPWAPIGAALAIIVAAYIWVAQWTLYPIGQTGQDNALRDLGWAILAGLASIRILAGQPSRHLVATGVIGLAGTALVLEALLASHSSSVISASEGICGVTLIGAALVCSLSPARRPANQQEEAR